MLRKIFSKIIKIRHKLDGSLGSWMLINSFVDDYKKYSLIKCITAHKHGFTVSDYEVIGIGRKNKERYITSLEYCKMHPINKNYSSWIDDKLTLKYLCHGSLLDKYMPRYYFHINSDGKIISLVDYKGNNNSFESLVDLLKEKKELALKKVSGTVGEGFYKMEYINCKYYLNDLELRKEELIDKIKNLKDYIVIEYFHPHESFNNLCKKNTNTIRYLCAKSDEEYIMVKSFIRFGTRKTGQVENYNRGGVLCYINSEGYYDCGNIIENNKNRIIYEHPDTSEKLKGKIPMWSEILTAVNEFCGHFPQLTYLGFDFVVTSDNRVIILEINSLTSLDTLQLDKSLLDTKAANFFRERMINK